MVTLPFLTWIRLFSLIFPDTSKTITLAPVSAIAALRLPVPESFRLVTLITLPPRPPVANFPYPSAPGNAKAVSCWGTPASGSLIFSFSIGFFADFLHDARKKKSMAMPDKEIFNVFM
ncbi:hypothetical protein D3C86_1385740 [compost metagenome]